MRTLLPLTGLCLLALAGPASAQVASVSMSSMTVAPGAREVVVESANVPDDGLLVARIARRDRMDWILVGQIRLARGESTNVPIALAREVRAGETVVFTLYADYGRKDFDDDPPVLSVDLKAAAPRGAAR